MALLSRNRGLREWQSKVTSQSGRIAVRNIFMALVPGLNPPFGGFIIRLLTDGELHSFWTDVCLGKERLNSLFPSAAAKLDFSDA